MWTLLELAVSGILWLIVILWTLSPLAQHDADRSTIGFWIVWGIIEAALIGFVVALHRKKK